MNFTKFLKTSILPSTRKRDANKVRNIQKMTGPVHQKKVVYGKTSTQRFVRKKAVLTKTFLKSNLKR